MYIWEISLSLAALWGIACSLYFKNNHNYISDYIASLPIPVSVTLYLGYMEYTTPYSGGGASMWFVAAIFIGIACFTVTGFFYKYFYMIIRSLTKTI